MKLQLNRTGFALLGLIMMGVVISGCSLAQSVQIGSTAGDVSNIKAAQVSSDLTEFDLSNNGVIDDDEFFRAIDLWIDSEIDDDIFFQVIDAWIGQALLGEITIKTDEPDPSRISIFHSTLVPNSMYILGQPGATEPNARVIVRDGLGNFAMTFSDEDGAFRFSELDLTENFDHEVGNLVEVTQQGEGKSWSNPAILVISFN